MIDVLTRSPADARTVVVSPPVRCRHWIASDRTLLLDVCGDADAMRWVGDGTVPTGADAGRWFEPTARTYARRGYGMFALPSVTTTAAETAGVATDEATR